jgi:hypothetical protein
MLTEFVDNLVYITPLVVTSLVLIITIFLFISIRNINNIKLKVVTDYVIEGDTEKKKITVQIYNKSKIDLNVIYVGFIANGRKIDFSERFFANERKILPILSHGFVAFEVPTDELKEIITQYFSLDKLKLKTYVTNSFGSTSIISNKKIVKFFQNPDQPNIKVAEVVESSIESVVNTTSNEEEISESVVSSEEPE